MQTFIIVVLFICLISCIVALLVVMRRAAKESVGAEIFHKALADAILEISIEEEETLMNSLSNRTQLTRFPVASHGAINHARSCYLFIARRVLDGRLD